MIRNEVFRETCSLVNKLKLHVKSETVMTGDIRLLKPKQSL